MVTDRAAARYAVERQLQNQARSQQYWYNAAAARQLLWTLPLFRQTHSQGVPMAMKIPRRKLGSNGLEVSAIGLGCMGMSDFYGPSDEETNLKVLNAAIDIGIDFLDTADIYGLGANERLLGKILATRRSEVVLATKFGSVRGPDGAFLGVSGTPEYVRASCDASLERLGVDHIDLYYQHRVDSKVAIEETVGAMADLVKAGKVRYLGLSEASARTLRRAAQVHPISALQSEYSLWTRDLESAVLPVCEELGIGVVAYSPLGRGFLTGAFSKPEDIASGDYRRSTPRFSDENFSRNLQLVEVVSQIAAEEGYTPAQVALAWLLDCAPYVVPIPGTRSIKRLKENALSVMVRLGDAHLERLYGLLRERPVSGDRYTAASMAAIDT
jgi:aryl-alcohol dehydrogenase-like predicted oxidoreductase